METLKYMENSLHIFHSTNDIFLRLKIKDNFDIPKIHSMNHYVESINAKGTADGYNTEHPEQLHINLSNELYHATNKKEYMQQMVKIFYQLETLDAFISFLKWAIPKYKKGDRLNLSLNIKGKAGNNDNEEDDNDGDEELEEISLEENICMKILLPKNFSFKSVLVQSIKQEFGATNFLDCIADFLKVNLSHNKYIKPKDTNVFGVYRCCKILHRSVQDFGDAPKKKCYQSYTVKISSKDMEKLQQWSF